MFKTNYGAKRPQYEGESVSGPSKTLPNQVLTIDQMLLRAKNGIPIPASRMQYAENEEDTQIIAKDLTDIDVAINEIGFLNDRIKARQESETLKPTENESSVQ